MGGKYGTVERFIKAFKNHNNQMEQENNCTGMEILTQASSKMEILMALECINPDMGISSMENGLIIEQMDREQL